MLTKYDNGYLPSHSTSRHAASNADGHSIDFQGQGDMPVDLEMIASRNEMDNEMRSEYPDMYSETSHSDGDIAEGVSMIRPMR